MCRRAEGPYGHSRRDQGLLTGDRRPSSVGDIAFYRTRHANTMQTLGSTFELADKATGVGMIADDSRIGSETKNSTV